MNLPVELCDLCIEVGIGYCMISDAKVYLAMEF